MRPSLVLAGASLLLLAGCSATPTPGPGGSGDGGAPDDTPCIVGTWQLDVADYATQSEAFVLGLGLPIVDFGMTGAGTITFTEGGRVSTDIDLTTTGTIVAGDTSVPLNQRSSYSGSGDWSTGSNADTIDLTDWTNVPDPEVPVDPAAPPIPAIDYTDIPTVAAVCSENDLVLQGPDAPLSALWRR